MTRWYPGTPPPAAPPPAAVPIIPAAEKCDARCNWPAQIRLVKTVSELCEANGEPHMFGVQRDLVFCTSHFRTHESKLRLDGWSQDPEGLR